MHLIESGRIVSRRSLLRTNTKKNVSRKTCFYQLTGYKKYYSIKSIIGIRAGGGRGEGRGGLQPPQILCNSDVFGQQEKIWVETVF